MAVNKSSPYFIPPLLTRTHDHRKRGRTLLSLFLTVLLLSSALSSVIDVPEVHPTQFGSFNFTELEDIIYDVQLLRVPIPERSVADGISGSLEEVEEEKVTTGHTLDSEPENLILISKYGQKYSCELPWKQAEPNSPQDKVTELNVTSLLLPLREGPCLMKTVGWWTYEYCHGQFVRQYHMEAGKVLGKIIWLGYYDNETVWDDAHMERVQRMIDSMKTNVGKGEYPVAYHGVTFINGTVCDITEQPRVAKVKLFCGVSGGDKLLEVVEQETCNYIITVQTSLLCEHPFFDFRGRGKPHSLFCSPLVSEDEYQRYEEEQERLQKEKLSVTAHDDGVKSQEQVSRGNEAPKDKYSSLFSQLFGSDKIDPINDNTDKDSDKTQKKTLRSPVSDTTDSADHSNKREVASSTQKEDHMIKGFSEELETVGEAIDILYKRLMDALDTQDSTDLTTTLLKQSIQENYKKRRSLLKEREDKLRTYEEKEKGPQEAGKTNIDEPLTETTNEDRLSNKPTKRPIREPHEVQGVGTDTSAHRGHSDDSNRDSPKEMSPRLLELLKPSLDGRFEELDEEEIQRAMEEIYDEEGLENEDDLGLSEESMMEIEEALSDSLLEKLQEAGLGGTGAEVKVKVFTLPTSVSELLDDDSEDDDDDDDFTGVSDDRKSSAKPGTIKVINFKILDDGKPSEDERGGRSSAFSQIFGQFFASPEDQTTPEQRKVKELENSYEQVWRENSNTQKKEKPKEY